MTINVIVLAAGELLISCGQSANSKNNSKKFNQLKIQKHLFPALRSLNLQIAFN